MSEFLFLFDNRLFLLLSWLLLSIWGLYVNTFRALIDRVRAGVSSLPDNKINDKLLHSLLAAKIRQMLRHPLPSWSLFCNWWFQPRFACCRSLSCSSLGRWLWKLQDWRKLCSDYSSPYGGS